MSKSRRPKSDSYTPEHPLLHTIGEHAGLGLGVAVTALLDLVPGWNSSLLDEDGMPVQAVEGAERIGDLDLEKRHTQVVGPQVDAYGDTLDDGWFRDLVEGFGAGATEGPGATYRLESALSRWWAGDE